MDWASIRALPFAERERELRRQERIQVGKLVEAATTGDQVRFCDVLETIWEGHPRVWAKAMREITQTPCPGDFRDFFLRQVYLRYGDHIRQAVGNNRLLADALRSLLPGYCGSGRVLYRGEMAWNRRRRTYGVAWSSSKAVAKGYATDSLHKYAEGGTVLLRAYASSAAIICVPAKLDNRYGEDEYVVCPRDLTSIQVLERFPQVPYDATGR